MMVGSIVADIAVILKSMPLKEIGKTLAEKVTGHLVLVICAVQVKLKY